MEGAIFSAGPIYAAWRDGSYLGNQDERPVLTTLRRPRVS